MKVTEKTRADSPLRSLPEERQAEIVDRLDGTNGQPVQTYAAVRQWLAEGGFHCTENALARFRTWHLLRQQRERNAEFARELVAQLREDSPELSPERLFNYGEQVFARLAIESQDAKEWARIQLVQQRQRKLEIEDRKATIMEGRLKLQEERMALAKMKLTWEMSGKRVPRQIIEEEKASNHALIEKLGRDMFGEDW